MYRFPVRHLIWDEPKEPINTKKEGGTLLDLVTRVRRVEDDLWSGRRNFAEAGVLRRKAIQEAIDSGHQFHEIAEQLRIHPEDVAQYATAPRS